MDKFRYALWVHIIDSEMKTRTMTVIKFWFYDSDEDAERELVALATEEALKDDTMLVSYKIRREDQDEPLYTGILNSSDLRKQQEDGVNAPI